MGNCLLFSCSRCILNVFQAERREEKVMFDKKMRNTKYIPLFFIRSLASVALCLQTRIDN